MSKHPRASKEPLTKKHKQQLDRIIENLEQYLQTPEGIKVFDQLESLVSRIYSRFKHLPALTEKEERALRFIRKELRRGHSPSVREVGRAVGP
jgi:hypothetical protein